MGLGAAGTYLAGLRCVVKGEEGLVLCRLEWGQLGLARQGWVGLNCGWLDLVGISLLVPSWIQDYWIGLGWS